MQIEVVNPDGGVIPLNLLEPVSSVTKAEQSQDLLGQDVVKIAVTTSAALTFAIGQKVLIFGKTYYMNQLPTGEVKGERHFEYDLTFEGAQYLLRKAVYFNTDVSGFNTSSDFPLTANVEMFLDVIINNLNRVFGAGFWVKGEFPTTAVKTVTFQNNNCLAALQSVCKEFSTEFDIVQNGSAGYTLNIRKAGQVLGQTYAYGRGYGLYSLKRQTVNDADIITRLYPFGSSKNLKSDYRNYSQRLAINAPGYIQDSAAVAAFGVIEGVKIYDTIFPHRTGTVTAVNSYLSFNDAGMNFDLAEKNPDGSTKYIQDGNTPKISFLTGNLAGYEFGLAAIADGGYTHTTKTFKILEYKDERGLSLPSATEPAFQFQTGDTFTILDIMLPDSYVFTAEAELQNAAAADLNENKAPKVQYSLEVDEMYLQDLAGPGSIVNFFGIGDYIHIVDSDLAIDKSSRIIGLRRDVLHPYRYDLTIDDTYQVNIIVNIIERQKETDKIIRINDLRDPNRARMGWRTTLEILGMVFDTDGYFDGGKIKPESIETLMLVVGARSQQFILQDVIFEPNFEAQANVVNVGAGLLIHYALAEEILTWNISASLHTIPDNKARYIYAKCNKTSYTDGGIIFSVEELKADADPVYYYFLVGILNSVMEGVRWISLTYGATAINGRYIKTGRLQSFDGLTFFDLDLSAIGGYIKFIDSEGNYRDLSDIGAATDVFYNLTINQPLEEYPNGHVFAWFGSSDPATWPPEDESLHVNDTFYNSAADYVYRRTGGVWEPDADEDLLNSNRKQFNRLGGGTHFITLFTATPEGPYKDGDLWGSPEGLRRSVGEKYFGEAYDPNDWVEPFNYDNTATAIDAGVITSGSIQLAGDKNAVWAGITGQGVEPDSVRFWAGASYVNRVTAPFRVTQAGQLSARTRIEVEGVDSSSSTGYRGQAGLAGSETETAESIRIYAGSDYEGKETADFRVNGRGFAWLTRAQLGNLRLEGSGEYSSITNVGTPPDDPGAPATFLGDALIALADPVRDIYAAIGTNLAPGTAGGAFTILMRVENNEVHTGVVNVGALFEASGATGPGAMNYNIYAGDGTALLSEALINGRRAWVNDLANNTIVTLDPTLWDFISVYPSGAYAFISFMTSGFTNQLHDGKIITVVNRNDSDAKIYLQNVVRGQTNFIVEGGNALTLQYTQGFWYCLGVYNNNWT